MTRPHIRDWRTQSNNREHKQKTIKQKKEINNPMENKQSKYSTMETESGRIDSQLRWKLCGLQCHRQRQKAKCLSPGRIRLTWVFLQYIISNNELQVCIRECVYVCECECECVSWQEIQKKKWAPVAAFARAAVIRTLPTLPALSVWWCQLLFNHLNQRRSHQCGNSIGGEIIECIAALPRTYDTHSHLFL